MKGRIGGALAVVVIGMALLAGGAAAARRPGVVLDRSFGKGGVVRLRDTNAYAAFGEVIRGGGLLVRGSGQVRVLDASGRPGKAFGAVGSLRPPAAKGTRFELTGFTVDSRGRLLVIGDTVFPESQNPSPPLENGAKAFYPEEVRIMRFLPGGRLDPSFGDGGVVETDLDLPPPVGEEGESLGPHSSVNATGVAVGPEGRIVVTGSAIVRLGPSCVHDAFAAVGWGLPSSPASPRTGRRTRPSVPTASWVDTISTKTRLAPPMPSVRWWGRTVRSPIGRTSATPASRARAAPASSG